MISYSYFYLSGFFYEISVDNTFERKKKSFMEVFNVLKQDNKQATVMGNTNVNSLLFGGLVFCWTTLFSSHPVPHTCKQTAWREILKLLL